MTRRTQPLALSIRRTTFATCPPMGRAKRLLDAVRAQGLRLANSTEITL